MKVSRIIYICGTVLFLAGLIGLIDLVAKNTNEISDLRLRIERLEEKLESPKVMSPRDFQKFLNEIEPKTELIIKEDGLVGPLTLTKWDRIYCNQCAKETFKN